VTVARAVARRLPGWVPVTSLALSLAALAIASYLTVTHYSDPTALACPDTGIVNCLKVTTSVYSYILGIPVALLGLCFFTAMLVINFPPLWRGRAPWVAVVRLALAVSGICFVLYLLAAELFSIKAICLWCTGVHVTTFLLFVLVVVSFPLMSPRAVRYREWTQANDA